MRERVTKSQAREPVNRQVTRSSWGPTIIGVPPGDMEWQAPQKKQANQSTSEPRQKKRGVGGGGIASCTTAFEDSIRDMAISC